MPLCRKAVGLSDEPTPMKTRTGLDPDAGVRTGNDVSNMEIKR